MAMNILEMAGFSTENTGFFLSKNQAVTSTQHKT